MHIRVCGKARVELCWKPSGFYSCLISVEGQRSRKRKHVVVCPPVYQIALIPPEDPDAIDEAARSALIHALIQEKDDTKDLIARLRKAIEPNIAPNGALLNLTREGP